MQPSRVAFEPVPDKPWREAFQRADKASRNIDITGMNDSIKAAFLDEDTNHRAILVAVDGKLVSEHYRQGFDRETRFLSWSAAKSLTATMIGVAVKQGLIDVEETLPAQEWKQNDPRQSLTWDDLLRMHSGLSFGEDYEDLSSDVNLMLFASHSAGHVAARQKLAHKPGEEWYYSSGTSNILARGFSDALEARGIAPGNFIRTHLALPLGLSSLILENR